MLTYLFYRIYFLCLLLFCFSLCVPVCLLSTAQEALPLVKELNIFEENEIENVKDTEGNLLDTSKKKVIFKNVKTYFLVSFNDFIIALLSADISYDEKNQKGGILAKFIEINKIDWEKEAQIKEQIKKGETQLASKIKDGTENFATGGFSAVVNNDKIFFFALNIAEASKSLPLPKVSQEITINFLISKFSTVIQSSQIKKNVWSTNTVTLVDNDSFLKEFQNKLLTPTTIDSSVFITNEKNIGLVINGTAKEKNEKSVYGFFKFKDTESEPNLSFVGTTEDCPSSFFWWGEKLIMIPTECNGGSKEVKWSTDMTQWKNDVGPFYYLCGILKDMRDFTATTIKDDKNVLLFTKKQAEERNKEVNLWMSDGNRLKKVGVIANNIEENVPIRIVVTKKELFFLYQKLSGSELTNIMLARSENYLKTITETLNAWNEADQIIQTLCTNKANRNTMCQTRLLTDGLVGFWSDNKEDSGTWKNKYFYMDAKVTSGNKKNNGFEFDKSDSNAVWSVGKTDDGALYNFAYFGFTFLATVTFDELTNVNQQVSVFGVTIGVNEKSVGVFCQNEEIFTLDEGMKKSANENSNKKCVKGGQYQVALVYNNSKLFVYIDWEPLGDVHEFNINGDFEKKDLKFYFGVYKKDKQISAAHMTVTNVLLYNRPFAETEIENLKKNINDNAPVLPINDEVDIHQNSKYDNSGSEIADINADETDMPSDTSNTQTITKESESLRPENSVLIFNIFVNVITLFLLFVVFTFAGHYV